MPENLQQGKSQKTKNLLSATSPKNRALRGRVWLFIILELAQRALSSIPEPDSFLKLNKRVYIYKDDIYTIPASKIFPNTLNETLRSKLPTYTAEEIINLTKNPKIQISVIQGPQGAAINLASESRFGDHNGASCYLHTFSNDEKSIFAICGNKLEKYNFEANGLSRTAVYQAEACLSALTDFEQDEWIIGKINFELISTIKSANRADSGAQGIQMKQKPPGDIFFCSLNGQKSCKYQTVSGEYFNSPKLTKVVKTAPSQYNSTIIIFDKAYSRAGFSSQKVFLVRGVTPAAEAKTLVLNSSVLGDELSTLVQLQAFEEVRDTNIVSILVGYYPQRAFGGSPAVFRLQSCRFDWDAGKVTGCSVLDLSMLLEAFEGIEGGLKANGTGFGGSGEVGGGCEYPSFNDFHLSQWGSARVNEIRGDKILSNETLQPPEILFYEAKTTQVFLCLLNQSSHKISNCLSSIAFTTSQPVPSPSTGLQSTQETLYPLKIHYNPKNQDFAFALFNKHTQRATRAVHSIKRVLRVSPVAPAIQKISKTPNPLQTLQTLKMNRMEAPRANGIAINSENYLTATKNHSYTLYSKFNQIGFNLALDAINVPETQLNGTITIKRTYTASNTAKNSQTTQIFQLEYRVFLTRYKAVELSKFSHSVFYTQQQFKLPFSREKVTGNNLKFEFSLKGPAGGQDSLFRALNVNQESKYITNRDKRKNESDIAQIKFVSDELGFVVYSDKKVFAVLCSVATSNDDYICMIGEAFVELKGSFGFSYLGESEVNPGGLFLELTDDYSFVYFFSTLRFEFESAQMWESGFQFFYPIYLDSVDLGVLDRKERLHGVEDRSEMSKIGTKIEKKFGNLRVNFTAKNGVSGSKVPNTYFLVLYGNQIDPLNNQIRIFGVEEYSLKNLTNQLEKPIQVIYSGALALFPALFCPTQVTRVQISDPGVKIAITSSCQTGLNKLIQFEGRLLPWQPLKFQMISSRSLVPLNGSISDSGVYPILVTCVLKNTVYVLEPYSRDVVSFSLHDSSGFQRLRMDFYEIGEIQKLTCLPKINALVIEGRPETLSKGTGGPSGPKYAAESSIANLVVAYGDRMGDVRNQVHSVTQVNAAGLSLHASHLRGRSVVLQYQNFVLGGNSTQKMPKFRKFYLEGPLLFINSEHQGTNLLAVEATNGLTFAGQESNCVFIEDDFTTNRVKAFQTTKPNSGSYDLDKLARIDGHVFNTSLKVWNDAFKGEIGLKGRVELKTKKVSISDFGPQYLRKLVSVDDRGVSRGGKRAQNGCCHLFGVSFHKKQQLANFGVFGVDGVLVFSGELNLDCFTFSLDFDGAGEGLVALGCRKNDFLDFVVYLKFSLDDKIFKAPVAVFEDSLDSLRVSMTPSGRVLTLVTKTEEFGVSSFWVDLESITKVGGANKGVFERSDLIDELKMVEIDEKSSKKSEKKNHQKFDFREILRLPQPKSNIVDIGQPSRVNTLDTLTIFLPKSPDTNPAQNSTSGALTLVILSEASSKELGFTLLHSNLPTEFTKTPKISKNPKSSKKGILGQDFDLVFSSQVKLGELDAENIEIDKISCNADKFILNANFSIFNLSEASGAVEVECALGLVSSVIAYASFTVDIAHREVNLKKFEFFALYNKFTNLIDFEVFGGVIVTKYRQPLPSLKSGINTELEILREIELSKKPENQVLIGFKRSPLATMSYLNRYYRLNDIYSTREAILVFRVNYSNYLYWGLDKSNYNKSGRGSVSFTLLPANLSAPDPSSPSSATQNPPNLEIQKNDSGVILKLQSTENLITLGQVALSTLDYTLGNLTLTLRRGMSQKDTYSVDIVFGGLNLVSYSVGILDFFYKDKLQINRGWDYSVAWMVGLYGTIAFNVFLGCFLVFRRYNKAEKESEGTDRDREEEDTEIEELDLGGGSPERNLVSLQSRLERGTGGPSTLKAPMTSESLLFKDEGTYGTLLTTLNTSSQVGTLNAGMSSSD